MKDEEIWIAVARTSNDLAGVFEFDGEVGYFYLYKCNAPEGTRIIGSIHIISGSTIFKESDLKIVWSNDEKIVALFINSNLWAAFDSDSNATFGGNYDAHRQPAIPDSIKTRFS